MKILFLGFLIITGVYHSHAKRATRHLYANVDALPNTTEKNTTLLERIHNMHAATHQKILDKLVLIHEILDSDNIQIDSGIAYLQNENGASVANKQNTTIIRSVPSKSNIRTNSTKPTRSSNPTNPSKPTRTTNPTISANTKKSTRSSNPINSTKSNNATKPTNTTKSSKSTNPTILTNTTKLTRATRATRATSTTKSTRTTNRMKSTVSTSSTKSNNLAKPTNSIKPTKLTNSTRSTTSTKPTQKSTHSTKPINPNNPTKSTNSSNSTKSTNSHKQSTTKPTSSNKPNKIVQTPQTAAQRECRKFENPLQDYILEGSAAKPGEFPWMAAIGYLDPDTNIVQFKCGGTIISEQFVMTAAHCIKDSLFLIRLGKTNLRDQNAVNRFKQNVIVHPKYSSKSKKNDIALIRLDKPIEFKSNIKPACLHTDRHDKAQNVELDVTGWGTTSIEKSTQPNELRKAKLTTVPISQCNEIYSKFIRELNSNNGIDESQYCAKDFKGKADSCQGDSGGPLQYFPNNSKTAHVIGITSFGIGCGKFPGVYTRVAYFVHWIESIVWPK